MQCEDYCWLRVTILFGEHGYEAGTMQPFALYVERGRQVREERERRGRKTARLVGLAPLPADIIL